MADDKLQGPRGQELRLSVVTEHEAFNIQHSTFNTTTELFFLFYNAVRFQFYLPKPIASVNTTDALNFGTKSSILVTSDCKY